MKRLKNIAIYILVYLIPAATMVVIAGLLILVHKILGYYNINIE